MKIQKMTEDEKKKCFAKMVNYIKKELKNLPEDANNDEIDDKIYYACRTMGATVFYDFISEHLE